MSQTAAPRRTARRTRLAAAAIALPLALGAVLTGCSSGQFTQTAEKRSSVEGSHAEVGDMRIVNAHFVAPDEGKYESGDKVDLEMVVASMGEEDEITLISIDGEDATITGGGAAESSGAASSSAPASSESTSGGGTITVPANGKVYVSADGGDATIEATMPDEVYPATLIPVTVTFKNAGEVEFNVPVAAPMDEIERDEDQKYTPSEDGEGGH